MASTLLLRGETGTGKGLVVRVIHGSGPGVVYLHRADNDSWHGDRSAWRCRLDADVGWARVLGREAPEETRDAMHSAHKRHSGAYE